MDCRATEGGLAPDAAAGAGAGAGSDGIVGGPRTPQQIASQKRLQATQAQVDEVVDIMKTNVEKVLERDQKLSELDDRAGKIHVILYLPFSLFLRACQILIRQLSSNNFSNFFLITVGKVSID